MWSRMKQRVAQSHRESRSSKQSGCIDAVTRKDTSLLQINLACSKVDGSWTSSIVAERDRIVWTSAQKFRSADQAYYRAIGEFVLRTSSHSRSPMRALWIRAA